MNCPFMASQQACLIFAEGLQRENGANRHFDQKILVPPYKKTGKKIRNMTFCGLPISFLIEWCCFSSSICCRIFGRRRLF